MARGVGVATVTSVIGPGRTVTSLVLTGVKEMKFDFLQEVIHFDCDQGKPNFDVTADTTFTVTVSGVTYTITVS